MLTEKKEQTHNKGNRYVENVFNILNLQKENRLCHHYKLNTKIPLIGLYYVSTGSGAFSFFFIVEYHKKDNLVSMLSLSSFC